MRKLLLLFVAVLSFLAVGRASLASASDDLNVFSQHKTVTREIARHRRHRRHRHHRRHHRRHRRHHHRWTW